jgi:hypothetical protein
MLLAACLFAAVRMPVFPVGVISLDLIPIMEVPYSITASVITLAVAGCAQIAAATTTLRTSGSTTHFNAPKSP